MRMKQALDILKSKGYKYTGKRERLVQIFDRENRYLTAKEVLAQMQGEYPGLSVDTVYRNLSLFERLGIIEGTEWEGERRYRFHCGDHHHHHLICKECGRTRQLNLCPMNAILGEPDDFIITEHKFEIYGYCQECEPASEKADRIRQ
ncbi:MAG: Fur family transcriptional regulator [Firmicutes bacterium]|uniref:Zinc uptake regulator, Fur family n=1 Tax=Melghirimyces thermohalophilus TaxID=1236220 RepID=A0A1G6QVY7_9BACL|nr:Fur family transcriptional regulator [Melghirimyces thermohalophilus]MDA8353623.1 Fur family transcriptional regulator [Bacillota bacterium]SDC96403.1 zinc uptake regulator, Fur family [Melghirimyces thermohalophilus]